MLKACSRCGKVHPAGECSIPKPIRHRVYGNSEERKFRSSTQWKRKREQILKRDCYVCRLCLQHKLITRQGLEVHHIVKIRNNESLKLVDTNLITLCGWCHERVENDKSMIPVLQRLSSTPPTIEDV